LLLTLDLGTTTTKAVVWDVDGPRAIGRAPLVTTHGAGDRAEQDPGHWWPAVVTACAEARAASPEHYGLIEAVGFSAARQTVVPVTERGDLLGPALLWSDRRAVLEAADLVVRLGGTEAVHGRSGAVLDGTAVAAKAAWLAVHDPDRWAAARWLLTPRDVVLRRMTGRVLTDTTMVSAAGVCDSAGEVLTELAAVLGHRLPPVVAPDTVAGPLAADAARDLGLRSAIPVVVGAGDRACEVLGSAAGPDRPMVSWGTTANVSVPIGRFPDPVPAGLVVTGAAGPGFLLEGGLSGAGSLLGWLSRLTGRRPDALMEAAAAAPLGAHGVVALPWFGGARAPWWRDGAGGAFLGLGFDHDAGDLARALVEAVAWEVGRCLEAAGAGPGGARRATSLVLTGTRATSAPWSEVLTSITGLSAQRRRSGQAASAGAAMLTARAIGADVDLDTLDPETETVFPDAAAVARYDALRPGADHGAGLIIGFER
jgi:xylulokinase